MRGWRRHIHHHPEAAGNEYHTAQYVFDVLREAGLNPELVLDGRGVVCDFGPDNGQRVALRADMDALEMPVGGREKVIHACGHDAHTAMVLAAGQALASNPDRLGEVGIGVRLVFQPAEEAAEGAEEMVQAGLLDGIVRAFALHCDPRLAVGEFGVVVGPMNASADKLTIDFGGEPTGYSAVDASTDKLAVDFNGPGGHTVHPEETADLIRAMSEFTATLQILLTGHIGADGTIEAAFGQFRAGEKMNAIPDSGRVEGMIRRAVIKYPIVHNLLQQRLQELKQRFDGLTYTLDHEPDADPADPSGPVGRPDGSVDLIHAIGEFTRDLDDALTERFESGKIVTVFGKAEAGYDINASHGAGTLTGTIRRAGVDKQEVEQFLNQRLTELKERFPGLKTQLHHDELVPTVVNDPESIVLFMKAIASLGPGAATAIQMSMGGDDFAHFLNHTEKSGAYVNVGIWSGEGDKYSLHQPPLGLDEHALDERALAYGARALAGTVLASGAAATTSTFPSSDRI
ncbi:amidohydrolase [Nocardia flavorosea]|uniref:amidohydrolase n=1 Tax=Nocardia flavorosea TaxID=53429 RepID=UPI0024810874|nr:amidohydrolase [Nocardia flavorosea]